jgi:hypothetical protein
MNITAKQINIIELDEDEFEELISLLNELTKMTYETNKEVWDRADLYRHKLRFYYKKILPTPDGSLRE